MKKENLTLLALATVLTLSTAPMALAADVNTTTKGIINFDGLDTDHDGNLTQTEFDSSSSFKGQKFSDLDKDNDGSIDGEELSTWARVHGKGNAVGSVHTNGIIGTTGTVGTIGVPSVAPNVNANVNRSVNKAGAGAAIGVKGNVEGTTTQQQKSGMTPNTTTSR